MILLIALLPLLVGLVGAPVTAQEDTHRAALVIRYDDGRVQTRCVIFTEPSITGEQLLQRSGLAVIMDYNSGLGGAVCSINGSGCGYPAQDCFCHCQGAQCEYWAYYHWGNGGWQYSSVGASNFQVTDGALEGWSWGPGNFSSGTEPPLVSFSDICTSPTATSTPTNTPTVVPPSPTPTMTPAPTTEPVSAPEVKFEAAATALDPGTCTILKWVTWDANQVTLNGTSVLAQDRQEVCPTTAQRYILVATNAAGQTQRELTVEVLEPTAAPDQGIIQAKDSVSQPTPTMPETSVPSPTTTPAAESPSVPTAVTPENVQPAPEVARASPTSTHEGLRLVPVAQAQALPTATASPLPVTTATPVLPPPHVLTPTTSPKRSLGADGRPTPTPILLAQVHAANPSDSNRKPIAQAPGTAQGDSGTDFVPPDRDFSLALLPGYAAFLFSAALLLGIGVVITRRRDA